MYYTVNGSGAPLVLLHGNGEDHSIFDKLSEKLRADFTLYAIDSRNHGKSEMTGLYSYETMAEDVYQFIKALNLGKVNLIGFSDGGIIGLILAMRHGEVLNRAALLGVNLKPGDFLEECYAYNLAEYEKTGDPLYKMMLEEPNIELDDVRGVQLPVLIVAAGDDIYKPGMFEELAAALPRGELLTMQGHNHESYIVGSDLLYPDLRTFFSRQ